MMPLILARIAPYLIAAAAIAAVLFGAYRHGYTTAENKYRAEIAQAAAQAQEAMRAQERQHAASMAEIDKQHQEAMSNANMEIDKLRADVRAGTVRLRERFTCRNAVRNTAASASSSDAATSGGLSAEDAGFLVRIAKEADDVARQLAACQAVVRADRD